MSTASITVLTPAAIGASQNNYVVAGLASACVVKLAATVNANITGLSGGTAGLAVVFHNNSAKVLTLKSQSALSLAANRFECLGDVVLAAGRAVMIQYNGTTSRWSVAWETGMPSIVESLISMLTAAVDASAVPGGSDTYVQFNDGGAFGASSMLTFNKATGNFSYNGSALTGAMSFIGNSLSMTAGTAYVVCGSGNALLNAPTGTAGIGDCEGNGNSSAFFVNDSTLQATLNVPLYINGTPALTAVKAYKSADESISSTTLQDDDHLTVSLLASSVYRIRLYLFISAGSAVEGVKLALDGTAGISDLKCQISVWDDVSNSLAAFARVTAFATSVGAGLSLGSAIGIMEGTIITSTAGTLKLSWAQNAGAGAAATTIQKGSSMSCERLA